MKRKMKAGITSVTLPIFVQDTSSTTGGGLSLAHNAAGLTAKYRRQGQNSWTTITLAAGTLGTWSSGGWVATGEITGSYEVGIPDAAVASNARWVQIIYYGASNMLPVLIEIELDAVNYQSTTAFMDAVASVDTVNYPVTVGDVDAAGKTAVRVAVGLANANLDTQLSTIAGYIDTEITTILSNLATIAGYIDTEVGTLLTNVTTLLTNLATVSGYVDTEVASILAAVDAEVAAILAAVDTEIGTIQTAVTAIKVVTDKLANMITGAAPNEQFTTNALENAPAGGGGGGGSRAGIQ